MMITQSKRYLYQKLYTELDYFKLCVLQLEKLDIYAMAGEIDSMIVIYEQMIEEIDFLNEEQINSLLHIPCVLDKVFQMWNEEDGNQDLVDYVKGLFRGPRKENKSIVKIIENTFRNLFIRFKLIFDERRVLN